MLRHAAAILVLVGCSSKAPEAPHAPATPEARPALETACQADTDCAVSSTTVSGASTCCPGCDWHAASATSSKAFEDSCKASPAPSCPALGCAMPIVTAKCSANVCVAVPNPG